MRSLSLSDRRLKDRLAALTILLTLVAPGLIPALASAAQISSRSIALSTTAASATGVGYEVKFTPGADADEFIVDFCNDSPVPGQTCTAPTGFDTTGVGTTTGTATVSAVTSEATGGLKSAVKVVTSMTSGTPVDVKLTGITNPSEVNDADTGFYGRIVTYNTGDADDYASDDLGSPVEEGGVALAITDSIGVTAAVREAMTFCISGQTIGESCDAGSITPANLELGESIGNAKALSDQAVSTGSVFTQLSTNAVHGAVVNLKSSATNCGGLLLLGDTSHCYIAAAGTTGTIGNGDAKFGIKLGASSGTSGVTAASGTLQAASANYDTSNFRLNGATDNSTGVTSAYGDPIINSNSLPVNNQNMEITFGASANSATPAGTYSANLSMIATGTF